MRAFAGWRRSSPRLASVDRAARARISRAEFKVDEAGVMKWAQHWHKAALTALEQHLAGEKDTGTYCQGEQLTIADICLASQVAGANFFKVDLAPYPTVARIAATCAKNDAFARAHPLKQPGAPAA